MVTIYNTTLSAASQRHFSDSLPRYLKIKNGETHVPMNGPFLRFVMSHPPHIFLAPLVGIFQYFKDVRFLVESLALYQIVRDNTKCAVFLQCPSADPQNFG